MKNSANFEGLLNNIYKGITIRNGLLITINLLVLPLLILVFSCLAIYRQLVALILFFKFGSQFGGLLSVYDAVHAVKNSEKNPICVLFLVKYNTYDSNQTFFELVKGEIYNKIFDQLKDRPKTFAIWRKNLGYPYLLTNVITNNEILKKLNTSNNRDRSVKINKNDLLKLVTSYVSIDLPSNGEGLWDLFVGTDPINWEEDLQDDKNDLYPILFRCNHILGDGESITKIIYQLFADSEEVFQKENNSKTVLNTTSNQTKPSIFDEVLQQVRIIWAAPEILFNQLMRANTEQHSLYGPELSGERIFVVGSDRSKRYVPVIKNIRRRIPNSTFLNVLLTAVSASFADYFDKNSLKVPNYLSVALPESPRTIHLRTSLTGKKKSKCRCHNNLSYTVQNLRINCGDSNVNLLKRMRLNGSLFRSQLELQVGYLAQTVVFGLMPAPFSDLVMRTVHVTAVVSNLPGPPAFKVFGGNLVDSFVPLATHRERTGITLVIFSYNGCLQLTLTVDKTLIAKEDDVQHIVNDIYKYLDKLDAETIHLVECDITKTS